MCRNIKPLFNFNPPTTNSEIEDAARQFVRKLTDFNTPSKLNEEAFEKAIANISQVTKDLFSKLTTTTNPKNREEEAQKQKEKNRKRFGEDT